jgi:PAS domain S-box-containing protein
MTGHSSAADPYVPTTEPQAWWRGLLAAIVLPLLMSILQWLVWPAIAPYAWLLFLPPVLLASWMGGFSSGLVATLLSTAIVWFEFIPPEGWFAKEEPRSLLSAGMFITTAVVSSLVASRLRRASRESAAALTAARQANESLKKVIKERRIFEALIENSSDFIGIADANGRLVHLNPGGRRMVGLAQDHAIEKTTIPDYYPPEQRAFVSDVILKDMIEKGRWEGETSLRHWETQEPIPVSDTHFMVREPETGEVLGIATITRDISELKRAHEELEKSQAQLSHELKIATRLQRIAARFVRDGDLPAVLDDIVEAAIAVTHADMGHLRLVEPLTGRLKIVAQRGFSQPWLDIFGSVDAGSPAVSGTPLKRGERLVVEDVGTSPLFSDKASREAQLREGVRAIQATPLIGGSGAFLGLLATHYRTRARLEERDLALLDLLAAQLAEILERSEAEQSIKQAAARLNRAQQIAHIGNWDFDLVANRITCSDEAYRILGLAPQEFGGTYEAFLEAVHPDDRATVDAAYFSSLREGRDSYALEHRVVRRSSGEVRNVYSQCVNVRDASGHVRRSAGTIQDITERKQIEQTLRDSEERFRLTIDEAPIGMALVGLDGRFVRVNAALCEIVGYPPDELTHLTFQAITHPDDLAADVKLQRQLDRGEIPRYELGKRYIRKDGAVVNIMLSVSVLRGRDGEALYYIAQVEDITDRKRAEEALRRSEQEFRSLAESIPQIVWATRPDGLNVYFNQQWVDYTGLTLDESSGEGWIKPFHPDDKQRAWEAWRNATQYRDAYSLECRMRRADGVYRWWLIRGTPVLGANGEITKWFGTCTDIEDMKIAEQKIKESEARFSGIVSISADAIVCVDEEQRITLFNRGAETIFGYSAGEAVGEPLDLLLPERLRAVHRAQVAGFASGQAVAKAMGERSAEIVGRRRNGQEFPAEASISRLEVGGRRILTVVLRDVTEARRVARDERFLADAGAVVTSSLDYHERLNDVARLTVRSIADLCVIYAPDEKGQFRSVAVIHSDPTRAEVCQRLAALSLNRQQLYFVSSVIDAHRAMVWTVVTRDFLQHVTRSAEWLEVFHALNPQSVMAAPLTAHGTLQGAILFASNQSGRYGPRDLLLAEGVASRLGLAIENARLYQDALLATQARDDVLRIVAHDLRNPLSGIRLAVTVLEHQISEEGRQRGLKSVATVNRSLQRAERLINDLLDVTRVEAGQLVVKHERVSAPQLLYDVVEAQQLLASSASIELRFGARDDLPDLQGDRDRLLQVMENLIGNAVRFTPPGGSITVSAEPHQGEVLFRVADTGSGVSPEHMPHLFERFWRARREERSGAGLGLPICKGIVEAHGGRIWAESVFGRGTTFSFTIPTVPREPDIRQEPAQPSA